MPLLALPGLSRNEVDGAVPGLTEPRIEALLRSLPKDARRILIPIGDTAARFLASGPDQADPQALKRWLQEQRNVPDAALRFEFGAVPPHLLPQVIVTTGAQVMAQGRTLASLRRATAAAARAELDRLARDRYGVAGAWRKFELDELPATAALELKDGAVRVFPTLAVFGRGVCVRYEWSAAEAQRSWRQGAAQLTRIMLAPQARELRRILAGDAPLMLAASPYFTGDALIELLLQLTFRRACFGEADAPRARGAFDQAVDQGRARLHSCMEEAVAAASGWFDEARAVRRALDGPHTPLQADAAAETTDHVQALLGAVRLESMPEQWLRQLPRYLTAEERRWQRSAARGVEPAHIVRELRAWSARHRSLSAKVGAEMRWIEPLDELRSWIEEYRVSLYAQELKTLGPVSAARLEQRASEIDAWVER